MDKESTESSGEMACEDIVWNIQMVVHVDEIGRMTCTPTELIERKSGKGWWRVCKETHCYRCEIINMAELKQRTPTVKGETIYFQASTKQGDASWENKT
eukprot:6596459-Heterocapsa_arctica.AAC.1